MRRDPDDPYNDHRAYASPRCVFPVVGAVVDEGQWHALDPDRRLAIPTGVDTADEHAPGALALAGRYDRIPSAYGWFRGSLVGIEIGIVLRHLALLSLLHDIRLDLHLPGPQWAQEASARLWGDDSGWSPPVLVTRRGTVPPAPPTTPSIPHHVPHHDEDAYTDLLRVYRSHWFGHQSGPVPTGVPDAVDAADAADAGSWADVLWRRSSGRMPRALYGFRVGDEGLRAADAVEVARWGSEQAPLRVADATGSLRLHAVVRDVDGLAPGVHDVVDGRFIPSKSAASDALTRFASAYLYGSDEFSRNDITRAPLVFVVTSRPRQAVARSGPPAWTALQFATGWLAHGLSLGAAARHLVARPVRALDERETATALGLDDDEMVGLAVIISHHAPHGGLQIDLRS